jgi:phosphatidylserine/phosphatidylglycerophosphate/cardiolipin synthase-like enzyme
MILEYLLVATGFTGAFTLLFLARALVRLLITPPTVAACFAPKGGWSEMLQREVKAARREILVVARRFRCRPLAKALVDAKLRGLKVEVVLDPRSEKESDSDLHYFVKEGLTPLLDTSHTATHHHLLLIDGRTLIVGALEFTQQAESDEAGSLLVLKGHPALVRAYRQQFESCRARWQSPGGKKDEAMAPTKKLTEPVKVA